MKTKVQKGHKSEAEAFEREFLSINCLNGRIKRKETICFYFDISFGGSKLIKISPKKLTKESENTYALVGEAETWYEGDVKIVFTPTSKCSKYTSNDRDFSYLDKCVLHFM